MPRQSTKSLYPCSQCGTPVLRQPSQTRGPVFCSPACLSAHRRSRSGPGTTNWQGGGVEKTCKRCGEHFTVPRSREHTALYCSRACLDAASVGRHDSKRVEKTCPMCGTGFLVRPSRAGTRVFCSMPCRNRADSEKRPPNYQGPRRISMGYVIVDHPSGKGRIYEHRLIAEQMIGRPLKSREVVHHVNENRSDNRPENLRVMTRDEHTRLHKKAG